MKDQVAKSITGMLDLNGQSIVLHSRTRKLDKVAFLSCGEWRKGVGSCTDKLYPQLQRQIAQGSPWRMGGGDGGVILLVGICNRNGST